MSEKQGLPEYSVRPATASRRQNNKRWLYVAVIAAALALGTFMQLVSFERVKRWARVFNEDKFDLAFPQQVAKDQSPTELNAFMKQLYAEFHDKPCNCRNNHQGLEDEGFYKGDDIEKGGKFAIAFPPEYARHGRPPRRHEPFCKPKDLIPSTTVFNFSPDEYKRASVSLDGPFSYGGYVTIDRASDNDTRDVVVNITAYVGRQELLDDVSVSGFEHQGQFAVQVKRKRGGHHHHHHHKKPPSKEDCVTYAIHVVFPSHLSEFDDLDLHIKQAWRIGTRTPKDISKLVFGRFRAGVGHGSIIFSDLKAKQITMGSLYGVVMGDYSPVESFASAAVRGASKVFIHPASEHINITSAAVVGPASVHLPADKFKGNFVVHTWTGSPIVKAPNPEDLHVIENKYMFKAGYYKQKDTGSNVVVHSKHGESELIFENVDGHT